MSVNIAPMQHSYVLADDFLDLGHWFEYASTSRAYGLAADASVEAGNALRFGASGQLALARETDIIPGDPMVLTYWAYALEAGVGPCAIQLRADDGDSFRLISPISQEGFVPGWNRVIVHTAAPAEWSSVQIGLFTTSGAGGYIARLRAMPADTEGIDQ